MGEIEVVKTKTKADNWDLAEMYGFIMLVKEHGKDWDKVSSDHATLNKYDRTADEMTKKYKNMKTGKFAKEYVIGKALTEKRSNESVVAFNKRKLEWQKKHDYKREKHNEIVAIIKEIEAEEVIASTAKKRTHQEMAKKISESENARKKRRLENAKRIEDLANVEVTKIQRMLDFLDVIQKRLERNDKITEAILLVTTQSNPQLIPVITNLLHPERAQAQPTPTTSDSQPVAETPTPLTRADLTEIADEVLAEEVLAEGFVNNTNQ